MIYFSLGLTQVNLPLMSLVDYRGFRLVAMCLLPVDKSTLIYGTSDGGRTIENKNETFAEIMRSTATALNLKPHECGAAKHATKVLHSAADIEGHLGFDGKFYLLDFSRTMPPVRPDFSVLNGHLYQLFRREFVTTYPVPLCSDAYSGFIMWDKKKKIHNIEIDRATDYLYDVIIPNCARDLVEVLFSLLLIHYFSFNLQFFEGISQPSTVLQYLFVSPS